MRILIAGGGTGGHIYPGIAVAEEIFRQEAGSEVLFVGTKQGMETKIIPIAGYRLETIPAGGIIKKNLLSKMTSGIKMIGGFIKSFPVLKRFNPDVVIGVGGYASVPMLSAAVVMRIPTVILEQNFFPGVANRVLSHAVDRVVVAFEGSKRFFRKDVDVLGNPVRRNIVGCEYHTGDIMAVLIFGGSQGAHAINKAVVESFGYLQEESNILRFIHQTGESDYAWVKDSYKNAGFDAEILPYIYHMEDAYRKADIVISRGGATTIAEITACGRPAILIPYPFATHDHQRLNAEYLQSMGAADVILERDLTGKKIAEKIKLFLYNRERLKEMSERSLRLHKRNAARDIVNLCRELANL